MATFVGIDVRLCGWVDNYAIGLHQGAVAVFGRINSGGASPETASGPKAANVAIPLNRATRVKTMPTPTAPDHQTRASAFIAMDVAIMFATTSQKTAPHSVASPRETYEPRGYTIGREPSATATPAAPKPA